MNSFDRKAAMLSIINDFQTMRYRLASDGRQLKANTRITPSQASLMLVLARHEYITSSDLADSLGISKGAITQLVDSLCDYRIVEKRDNNEDRRSFYLCLTRKGKRHTKRLQEEMIDKTEGIFNRLSSEDLALLSKIFDKLAK